MSSSGNIQAQYDYYFFLVYGKFSIPTYKSDNYKTLRGAKTKATTYLYDYINNHTNKEIANNCIGIIIYNTKDPEDPICTKYTESLERWEYHD